ncbi:MAG TPA: glycine cleavage T C-terminal barrel domain-containing protein [Candidatus Bathyarchaeia archaeon]|nr:glycine cleavage T C-terminal barrel domain-containing protein [Candidatus Bathyarchaeia archaeon]
MSNPLTIHHERLGAELAPDSIPLSYTDAKQEYWTIRKNAGISDISNLGRLTVKGKDRSTWLNGLVTNEISKLGEDAGVHAALLNTKARVLADLYIYSLGDHFLVDTGNAPASKVKQILDQFIITEQVKVDDSSQDLVQITLQGPKSSLAIKQLLDVDVSLLSGLHCKQLGPSIIISRDRSGVSGFDIVLPRDESEAVWQAFMLKAADSVQPVGSTALDILRLEAGIPKYGTDVDENNIILESGFKDAISFSKGCYMGQEVVARATHIGRVNKQLAQFQIETTDPPPPKTKLTVESRDAGYLTSAAYSPGIGKVVALGYANRDFAKENTRLTVDPGTAVAIVTRII